MQAPNTRPAPYLEEFDPPIDVLNTIKSGRRGERQIIVSGTPKVTPGEIVQLSG